MRDSYPPVGGTLVPREPYAATGRIADRQDRPRATLRERSAECGDRMRVRTVRRAASVSGDLSRRREPACVRFVSRCQLRVPRASRAVFSSGAHHTPVAAHIASKRGWKCCNHATLRAALRAALRRDRRAVLRPS